MLLRGDVFVVDITEPLVDPKALVTEV